MMPRLSDSMEQGPILRWLIADGERSRRRRAGRDRDRQGDMTYESELEGTLQIVAARG